MKLCMKILAIAIVAASTYSLIGCAAPAGFSYQNVGITISTISCSDCVGGTSSYAVLYSPVTNPQYPLPIPLMSNQSQGGTYLFTASVTNAPANVTWTLYPSINLVGEGMSGTLTYSGHIAEYAQNGTPYYSGAKWAQAQAMGIPQGSALLVGTVPSDPNNPSAVASVSQLIQIFNDSTVAGPPAVWLSPRTPTTPAGLTNPVITVSHLAPNNTYPFQGGTYGAAPCLAASVCGSSPVYTTDNTSVWMIGPSITTACVTGPSNPTCSTALGTIDQNGLYTAPSSLPLVPPPIVIVIQSHALPTIQAFAYIAVN